MQCALARPLTHAGNPQRWLDCNAAVATVSQRLRGMPFQPDVPTKLIGDYFRTDANLIRLAMGMGMGTAMSFTVLYFMW